VNLETIEQVAEDRASTEGGSLNASEVLLRVGLGVECTGRFAWKSGDSKVYRRYWSQISLVRHGVGMLQLLQLPKHNGVGVHGFDETPLLR